MKFDVVVGAAAIVLVHDHDVAVGKDRDTRVFLVVDAAGGRYHAIIGVERAADAREAPEHRVLERRIARTVGIEREEQAAVAQHHDVGRELIVRRGGVDDEFRGDRRQDVIDGWHRGILRWLRPVPASVNSI